MCIKIELSESKKRGFVFVSALLSTMCTAVGCVILLAWKVESSRLLTVFEGAVTMKPATAMLFVFQGLASLTFSFRDSARIGGLLVLTSMATAAVLAVSVVYPDLLVLGMDADPWTVTPGMPSFGTIGAFFLLLCLDVVVLTRFPAIQGLALAVMLIGVTGVAGYWLGIPAMFFHGTSTGMAVHTAVGLILLGLAKCFAVLSGHRICIRPVTAKNSTAFG